MAVVEQHNKASQPIEDDQPIIYTQVNKDTSLGAYCYVAPPVPEKNKDVPSEYCVAMATGGNEGEVSTEEPRVTSEYCEVSHHDQVPSNTEQPASSALVLSANPSVPIEDDRSIIYSQVNKDTSLGAYCYVAPPVPEKNKDVLSEYCVAMVIGCNGGEVSTEKPMVTSEYCEVSHHDQVPSDTERPASSALSANPSVPTQDGGPNEPAQQVVSEYSVIQPVAGDSVPQQPVSSSSQPGLYDRLQHNLGITSNTTSSTHDTASIHYDQVPSDTAVYM